MSRTTGLLDRIRSVETPTLGHFLEEGFCRSDIAPVGRSSRRMVGHARTLDLRVPDAIAVNDALISAKVGEVLVIRVEGAHHAPVGAVTAAAARARGLEGIVVDGPVTDRTALEHLSEVLPIYSTGFTARTTKRLGSLTGGGDVQITVGGVRVHPGDIVVGDEHGILILPPEGPGDELLERAHASDTSEPALLSRIESGVELSTILAVSNAAHTPKESDS